jgi:hypothetical protein
MQVQFELVVGENKFTLTENVENHSEFFQKLHFYSTLPKVGPNGETDLVLTFRVAQGQYEYYSIVSKKAGLEYKFGQSKKNDGSLFGKGWEPVYNANGNNEEGSDDQGIAPGQSVGLGAPASAPPQQTTGIAAAPKVNAASKPVTGLGATAAKPTPATASTASGPIPIQVQNQAKNVLSKFGI